MTSEQIHSVKEASDTTDLKKFCSKQGLPFHVIDLSELSNLKHKAAYIHTGEVANQVNGGNPNHWLFIYADLIFDSYGKYKDYDFGDKKYEFIKTNPRQLQTYNTTVCGSYCSMFYYFVEKVLKPEINDKEGQDTINSEDIGLEFSEHFGFVKNKVENDKIAYEWMQEHM